MLLAHAARFRPIRLMPGRQLPAEVEGSTSVLGMRWRAH